MGSMYDTNFLNNLLAYRNKKRLAGGIEDPRMIGAMLDADLSARYSNENARKTVANQTKSLENQAASIANQGTAYQNQYNLGLQQLRNQANAQKATSQGNLIGGLAMLPQYGKSIYDMFTTKPKTSQDNLADAITKMLSSNNGGTSVPTTDTTDYSSWIGAGQGDTGLEINQDTPWWESLSEMFSDFF